MFWQCCRRSNEEFAVGNGQDNTKKHNKNESRGPYHMDIRLSTISNGSLDSNGNNGPTPVSMEKGKEIFDKGRIRTHSYSSVKSTESFYSVKSSAASAGGDGDFYSVCSVDSFKST